MNSKKISVILMLTFWLSYLATIFLFLQSGISEGVIISALICLIGLVLLLVVGRPIFLKTVAIWIGINTLIVVFLSYVWMFLVGENIKASLQTILLYSIPALILMASLWLISKVFTIKPLITRIILTLVLVATLLGHIYFGYYFYQNHKFSTFNQDKWTQVPTKRAHMIDDILEKQLLNKSSKSEILELLGEPDDKVYQNEYSSGDREPNKTNDKVYQFIYEIGYQPGNFFYSVKLFIVFDENEYVGYHHIGSYL